MVIVNVLIDGFNLYHSLRENPRYKWIDLRRLAQFFLKKNERITKIYYFTSIAYWDTGKVKRHGAYIKALRHIGIDIIKGRFKDKNVKCLTCNKWFPVPVEKETDVKIATKLFELAFKKQCDKLLLISGDTDLAPAIKLVKKLFPDLDIHIVFPKGRTPKILKKIVPNHYSIIKEKHLMNCRFPDRLASNIYCPPEWM